MIPPEITKTDRYPRMRCWCEDECLCGADEANERLTEAEEAYGRELAAQAESEAWRHLQEASA